MDILFAPNGSITGRAATTDVIHLWIAERTDRPGVGADGQGGTADDLPAVRPHKLVSIVVQAGAIIVTDNPDSVGNPTAYSTIYDPPSQRVGVTELNLP
jgi:hypothetical protein